ncbi:hypothetical protein TorRG33x02_192360 [Trema orientale]|uniref:Uncharacterized protein n=1 Tax=Trema orientale TaxID=63057 RepID=A0A2P5EHK0_TREOI|nr:hypothetical protein TorRG33x02_192360 [Trema orientale]
MADLSRIGLYIQLKLPLREKMDYNEFYERLIRSLDEQKQLAGRGGVWTWRDVREYMCGFKPNMIDEELEMVSRTTKGEEMEIFGSTYDGKKKERLEDMLRKGRDRQIDQVWECLKLTTEKLQLIEADLFLVLRCFVPLRPDSQTTKSQLREFRAKLTQLKDSKNGRVPIVVLRSLAAVEGLLSLMEETKCGDGGERHQKSDVEIANDEDFDKLVQMFWDLEFVLICISSLLISEQNKCQYERCDAVLAWSNETLKSISERNEAIITEFGPELRRTYRKNKRRLDPRTTNLPSKKPRGGGESSHGTGNSLSLGRSSSTRNHRTFKLLAQTYGGGTREPYAWYVVDKVMELLKMGESEARQSTKTPVAEISANETKEFYRKSHK